MKPRSPTQGLAQEGNAHEEMKRQAQAHLGSPRQDSPRILLILKSQPLSSESFGFRGSMCDTPLKAPPACAWGWLGGG